MPRKPSEQFTNYRVFLKAEGREPPLYVYCTDKQEEGRYYAALLLSKNTGPEYYVEMVKTRRPKNGGVFRWRYISGQNKWQPVTRFSKSMNTPTFDCMEGADVKDKTRRR